MLPLHPVGDKGLPAQESSPAARIFGADVSNLVRGREISRISAGSIGHPERAGLPPSLSPLGRSFYDRKTPHCERAIVQPTAKGVASIRAASWRGIVSIGRNRSAFPGILAHPPAGSFNRDPIITAIYRRSRTGSVGLDGAKIKAEHRLVSLKIAGKARPSTA